MGRSTGGHRTGRKDMRWHGRRRKPGRRKTQSHRLSDGYPQDGLVMMGSRFSRPQMPSKAGHEATECHDGLLSANNSSLEDATANGWACSGQRAKRA